MKKILMITAAFALSLTAFAAPKTLTKAESFAIAFGMNPCGVYAPASACGVNSSSLFKTVPFFPPARPRDNFYLRRTAN